MLGLALFGCGRIGKVHAESIAAHPQAELIWVCDPMEEAARSLAGQYGAAASHDTGAVLADPRVDAVVVASPTPTHVDLLTRSVRAGKAVLRGADGALCQITNSRRCAFGYDQRIEAFGERGMLTAGNVRPTSVRFSGADETEAAAPYLNFFLDRYATAYRAELGHFLSAIETGTRPEPGFADGRAALALAEAASESARTGRVVPVNPPPRVPGGEELPAVHSGGYRTTPATASRCPA